MIEKTVAIKTADGVIETFLTAPQAGGPFPTVVLYMDVWGIREELFDIARRVGVAGYCCVVPDFYYRWGRVRNEFRNQKNEMISLEALSAEDKQTVLTPLSKLTDDMVVRDTGAILTFLETEPLAGKGAVGGVGYCMGGRHVFKVAGAYPERFKAIISLHGTNLVTEQASSPHLSMKHAQGEVYCGFAENDPYAPQSTRDTLASYMRNSCAAAYSFELHPRTEHGYALPDRDIFNKQAFNRDWEIIFNIFKRQLGS